MPTQSAMRLATMSAPMDRTLLPPLADFPAAGALRRARVVLAANGASVARGTEGPAMECTTSHSRPAMAPARPILAASETDAGPSALDPLGMLRLGREAVSVSRQDGT